METIKITRISRTQKTSKAGKPYTSLGLQTDKYGDKWINGFGNKDNADWKQGDEVELTVKEVEKDGNTYLNFETPKREDKSLKELNDIALKVGKIDLKLDKVIGHLSGVKRLDLNSDGSEQPKF